MILILKMKTLCIKIKVVQNFRNIPHLYFREEAQKHKHTSKPVK